MFKLTKLPPKTREAFRESVPIVWPVVVTEAIELGFKDLDDLTNLVFFMHHKERMDGGTGQPLSPSEPQFKPLAEEWKAWRTMIKPMLKAPAGPSGGAVAPIKSDWSLSDEARHGLKDVGGEALLKWAEVPPDDTDAREFVPAPKLQREGVKTIFAWKSMHPNKTCRLDSNRIQFLMMVRDDLAFWRDRTPNERQAQIRQTTQEVSIRAYRHHIIENRKCPAVARQAEIELGKKLILQMAGGLLGIIPTPGVKGGSSTVKSIGELVKNLASLLND